MKKHAKAELLKKLVFYHFSIKKILHHKTQGFHMLFFTLLDMLENYEPWSIVFIVEEGELELFKSGQMIKMLGQSHGCIY